MFSGIVERMAEVVEIRTDDPESRHNMNILAEKYLNYKPIEIETLIGKGARQLTMDLVNVERSMRPDALLDGHIVQGHVDQTARCTAVEDAEGSWYYTFEYEPQGGGLCTVEKGSVAVNGVSLTVCDSKEGSFRVAIIPYTYAHTNFCRIGIGSVVNLEFDIVGKYIARLMEHYR